MANPSQGSQSATFTVKGNEVLTVKGDNAAADSLSENTTYVDKHVSGSRSSWQEIVEIICKVALALDHADENDQLFGTIQTGDVSVTHDGNVRCDFREDQNISMNSYTAPEQLTGRDCKPHQTELYRLGVVFYKLLTQREPFRAVDAEVLREQILRDDPQPPRQLIHGLPKDLDSICLRLLAKSPYERGNSGRQLVDDLQKVLRDHDEKDESQQTSQKVTKETRYDLVIVRFESASEFNAPSLIDESGLQTATTNEAMQSLLAQANATSVSWDGNELLFQLEETSSHDEFIERVVKLGAGLLRDAYRLACKTRLPYRVRVESAEIDPTSLPENSLLDGCRSTDLIRRVPRVVGEASPDSVVVDHASWKSLHRWVEHTRKEDSAELRFGTNPDRLQIKIEPAGPSGETAGPVSPLAIAKARWEQAVEGLGQMVLIIGDEGTGKTRLVDEVVQLVLQTESSQVVTWHCLPGGQERSFHPLTRALDQMTGIRASDETINMAEEEEGSPTSALSDSTAGDRLDLIQQFLEGIGVSDGESSIHLSRVMGPEKVQSGADEVSHSEVGALTSNVKESVHDLIFKWLGHSTRNSPVLFVVEDLQWSDPATLELISRLASDRLFDHLLLLATFRPEFETLWGSRAHQTQVALRRLSKKHIQKMIQSRIDESLINDDVVEQAVHTTGGVPLYLDAYLTRMNESKKRS